MRANPKYMSPLRMVHDLRDLYRSLADMLVLDDFDEEAGYELAVSARRFSQNTQAVVDDKLNFSATLMRAGEVDAANRLLEEFQKDVIEEEVALIERVNEVKAAESVRRQGITRVRLARVLAVAMVGSSLLSFSAAGMALAGLLKDRAESEAGNTVRVRTADIEAKDARSVARPRDAHSLRRVRIGDVKLMLTASQLRTIRELGGTVDASGLQGIIGFLPRPLAEKVQQAIVVASAAVQEAEEVAEETEMAAIKKARRKARQAERAAQAEAEAEENSTPSPQPSDPPADDDGAAPDDGSGSNDKPKDDDGRSTEDEDDGLEIPGGDRWN